VHGRNDRNLSLYSSLYLKLAKIVCLSYYLCVFSSTKLEKRAEQFLPGSEREEGEGKQEGEMAQTMYAHMNKSINNKKYI
jgi:hypothetical protein